jgi:YYY domain-containing protein
MDGYDGFGGIYRGGLNFEMYWDDNADKYERFVSTLDEADYIIISSNRQWATTTRVPERYPLTTAYYRALIGCPVEQDVIWCYNVARPGDFDGELGFELVQVFESFPGLNLPIVGRVEVNDQFAEEAFTVYDHPKVLIFKKTAEYSPAEVRATLGRVDLNRVVRLIPGDAASYPGDLMLPPDRLAAQQAGGTWSELFDTNALHNSLPGVGLALWYFTIFLLGLATFPILRPLLRALPDGGYPLARIAGLLLLAWLAWMAGSLGLEYSRLVIASIFGALIAFGLWQAYRQRAELRAEWQSNRRYYLLVEGLFLALFAVYLLVRFVNPDMWHPAKGGERPMDFSYLNAVLKSTSFPAFDPWFAGGYINYYYFGFVLAGTPIKMLGIVPAIAYNFVLPTLFAALGVAGFSVVWNLVAAANGKQENGETSTKWYAAFAATAGLVLLGNLGIPRMIWWGFERLAAPGGVPTEDMSAFERIGYGIEGLIKVLAGARLPFAPGDWYWFPSRVIPAPGDIEPITEFPLFTFIYSDLHAHMIALPLTVLAIAFALAVFLTTPKARDLTWWFLLAFGGLVIGSLRPTNTWDFPTYLVLGVLATLYAVLRRGETPEFPHTLAPIVRRALFALISVGVLVGASLVLYQPYAQWYGLGYGEVKLWEGGRTGMLSYLSHWGLFLFIIISWMVWETRDWMATTPVSALGKLRPYQVLIELVIILLVAAVIGTLIMGVKIGWFVLPLALWAAILLLRPGMSDSKRGVLFLVGTGLTLTLVVELVVLVGDIGRMNTVFKFYLQVWTMFGLSAAASLAWLLPALPQWTPNQRSGWMLVAILLVTSAAMYPLLGGSAKMMDRMAPDAPMTLDSMEFMKYATYYDQGQPIDMAQDYRAIRWLQENVVGSPVIVEANTVEYRLGSRITMYTGLPGVLGWNWHQRQQRALVPPNWITDRVADINAFYLTAEIGSAREFLRKYNVRYIIVGQYERAYYPGIGLEKFPIYAGRYWNEVYRDGEMVIYEVMAD